MILRALNRPPVATQKALIVGPYRVHNFGDDLIGAIIAKKLQREGYEVSIPRLGAENVQWLGTGFSETYGGQFESADLIVVGGGGIMSDTAGAKPGASYLEIVSRAAHDGLLNGKRLVVTGVGAGPWLRDKSRNLALEISTLADVLGVRDPESADHLRSLGVAPAKIVTGADVALLTSEYLRFRARRSRRIGIQFDVARFADVHENPAVSDIAQRIGGYAAGHPRDVVLVSNGRHRSQVFDVAPTCDLLRYGTLKDFLPRLAGLRAILTSHLHLAIAAYSQRIPPFSLYVREKTRRFYDQIGHPERAIDLRTATRDDLDRFLAAVEVTTWTSTDEVRLRALKVQAWRLLDVLV